MPRRTALLAPALLAPVLLLSLTSPVLLAPLAGPAAATGGPVLLPGDVAVLRGSDLPVPAVTAGPGPRAVRASGGALRNPGGDLRAPRSSARQASTSTFVVTYTGFSPVQRDAFQLAVDTWERLLTSTVPIRIDARLEPLPAGVLGAAGAVSYAVDDRDGRYGPEDSSAPIALANARAGRDLDPARPDIAAEFSGDTSLFSYGTASEAGRYDFTTVVLHEIAHGLGFAGAMSVQRDATGVERGYWDAGTTRPRPDVFDRRTGALRPDGSVVPLLGLGRGSTALAEALTEGRTQWLGPAGAAAGGGVRPELYTPPVWEQGSSYSHLDEAAYPPGTPDALMTPLLDLGEVVRDPGAVALGMLADVGWGSDTRTLRLTGPETAAAGTRVAVTGTAAPGSDVRVYFKRRGSTSTSPGAQPGFVLLRQLPVGEDGSFSTTYVASDDHRYYAQVADQPSPSVLTQVRPTFTGPGAVSARRGATVTTTGRGLPGTPLALRFTRGTTVVTRTVTVRPDGTWSRSQVLTEDVRVDAQGSNGQRSDTTVLLQTR